MSDKIKILKIREVKTPTRANPTDAGIDFYVPEDFGQKTLNPLDRVLIPSGIKIKLPEGFALVANNKSGVATKKGLIVGAAVVDESYQGEMHLSLINVSNEAVMINPGDKIIQFLLEKQYYYPIEEVDSVVELFEGLVTERGEGGFGSTGN